MWQLSIFDWPPSASQCLIQDGVAGQWSVPIMNGVASYEIMPSMQFINTFIECLKPMGSIKQCNHCFWPHAMYQSLPHTFRYPTYDYTYNSPQPRPPVDRVDGCINIYRCNILMHCWHRLLFFFHHIYCARKTLPMLHITTKRGESRGGGMFKQGTNQT